MVKRRFRCLNCGHNFEAEVLEDGEAEARRVYPSPVHCPKCNRTDLEPEK